MPKMKLKASQVNEDTLQDKDADTMVSVEANADEDKIRFMTANTERMIIQDDGKVGIGDNITPGYKLDVDGDVRIRGGDIRDNSGEKVIEMDGSGYLKFTKGVKYARGVLASSSSSPAESGGWIKFASFDSPGTSNLDTAASSFLVCFAGQESSNNRKLDGLFLVHAKHTVNTLGIGTDGGSVTNAYYEPEGTFIVCEPLHAQTMAASGVNDFDPSTDLIMILENDRTGPTVDLYLNCRAKGKRCFVTHLGGTGQTDTNDTDIGFTINTGESWLTTEPTAPAGSVKLTGNYTDKRFNNVSTNDLTAYGSIITENNIQFQDNNGTFPTNSPGFFWDLNNDEARIYAKQPSSDAIDFVFKLSDNNHSQDRYIFWIDDYRGSSYDRYPLSLRGDGVFFNMVHDSEGVPNFTTAKARIDNSGRLALRTGSDPSTVNDNAHIYSKNISGHAEMFVRDSQGNVTQISPHNDEGEWQYFSRNTKTGKVVKVNMEKMIRKLEEITGESFMEEYYEDPTDT